MPKVTTKEDKKDKAAPEKKTRTKKEAKDPNKPKRYVHSSRHPSK
jgi:hypothetical protein